MTKLNSYSLLWHSLYWHIVLLYHCTHGPVQTYYAHNLREACRDEVHSTSSHTSFLMHGTLTGTLLFVQLLATVVPGSSY